MEAGGMSEGLKFGMMEGSYFPLVVTHDDPSFDIVGWAKKHQGEIREYLNKHGAVLFRGFDIGNVEEFERLAVASTNADWVPYLEATSPRDHVKSRTSTSTRYQNDRTIFFHNEKSYSGEWPYNLFFYCDVEPHVGGETPLSDCRQLYLDIPEDIREKFERKKLKYVRRFSNNMGIPWKQAFNVETREDMEKFCRDNYIEDLQWAEDGTPIISYVRNTAIEHPLTGERVWFNHGTFFNVHSLEPELKEFFLDTVGQEGLPYNTYYGDGEEIEEEVIEVLRYLYEKNSYSFKWQKKDVILIDNMLLSHGRRPFEGDRSILVTMTGRVDYAEVSSV